TSGANRADPTRLATLLGAEDVRRAGADEARAATGFAIGGTPPFGYPRPLPVLMDEDLLRHEAVWAASGTPDGVFRTDPQTLLRVTAARVAAFREG
ncbi:MAG TPA: YbaK/EbsC family protein, partial [Actinomycetota bacterium]|nr:YbaK/EbsC family protein [Actinomycetota bacterium]